MPLTEDDLALVAQMLAEAPTLRAAAGGLRERFAPMRATVVDAHDMREEQPALRTGRRALYLAETDGHCWTVTRQPAMAAVLILTED